MRSAATKKWGLWPILFIFIPIGFMIYGSALGNRFVWDDEEQILNNSAIHSLRGIPQAFGGSSFNSGGGGAELGGIYYKPLMVATYGVLWAVSGGEPFVFHLFQLSLHIASAILLAVFLAELFPELVAGGIALIFLVHPLNVECVAYAADLQDALFFFFGISALSLLAKRADARAGLTQLSLCLCLLLSLLSKESGVLFLPVAVSFAFLFKRDSWRRVLFSAALALGIYCVLRFGVAGLGIRAGNLQPISRASFSERLLSLPKILFFYFSHFLFPVDLAISQHWVVREASRSGFFLPLAADLAFLGALWAGLRGKLRGALRGRGEPRALFFLLWFACGAAFHSQLFPLDQTVADRWFYFTMVGLLGLIALALEGRFAKRMGAVLLAVALALSIQSTLRAMDWRDGLTLYSHDLKLNPEAYDLQNNLGVELFRGGDVVGARPHFEESVRLAPHWWCNWNNLGAVYERLGEQGQAEKAYRHAISNGAYYLAYENLALSLTRQGRYAEARDFLQKEALVHFPGNPVLEKVRRFLSSHEGPTAGSSGRSTR